MSGCDSCSGIIEAIGGGGGGRGGVLIKDVELTVTIIK